MAFVVDLLHHELEVITSFFSRGAALVATENAAVQVALQSIESPDNEHIEDLCCHPNGPVELEQIICRATINELNALIEAALQEAISAGEPPVEWMFDDVFSEMPWHLEEQRRLVTDELS